MTFKKQKLTKKTIRAQFSEENVWNSSKRVQEKKFFKKKASIRFYQILKFYEHDIWFLYYHNNQHTFIVFTLYAKKDF